jgi:hypothetical protein
LGHLWKIGILECIVAGVQDGVVDLADLVVDDVLEIMELAGEQVHLHAALFGQVIEFVTVKLDFGIDVLPSMAKGLGYIRC